MQPAPAPPLADRVRQLMAEKSISQETVAAALGISQESVSRRVRGVMEWRISELHTVAGLLDVTVAELLDGTRPTARAS